MAIQFALDLFPAGFTVCYHFLLYTRHLSRMESGPSITSLRLLLDYVRKICLAASSKLSLLHFLPAEEYTPFCLSVSQSFLTSCLPSHSPYWPLACLSVSVLLDLLADFLRPFHLPFNVLSFPLPFHFLISCSCSVPPFLAVLSFLFFLHVVVVVCLAFCLLAVLPSCLLLVLSFSHDAFVPFYLQILLDQNFPRFNGSIQKFKFKHKIFHPSV